MRAVKKLATFFKIELKSTERLNSSFQSNYFKKEELPTPVQVESVETNKSEKINPALPITDMAHLLDLNPRLERSRYEVRIGHYLGQQWRSFCKSGLS